MKSTLLSWIVVVVSLCYFNTANADRFSAIEDELKAMAPPINISTISNVCSKGADKIACQLTNHTDTALLIGITSSTVLSREAATIDFINDPKNSGYELKTPQHGSIFQLSLVNPEAPVLPNNNYSVMLEDWVVGSKIDNGFSDFATKPKNKVVFDSTQLGQAIINQQLDSDAVVALSGNINNYKTFVNDVGYVIDVEYFVGATGDMTLVDLAGGIGTSASQKGKISNRLTNAIAAMAEFF